MFRLLICLFVCNNVGVSADVILECFLLIVNCPLVLFIMTNVVLPDEGSHTE